MFGWGRYKIPRPPFFFTSSIVACVSRQVHNIALFCTADKNDTVGFCCCLRRNRFIIFFCSRGCTFKKYYISTVHNTAYPLYPVQPLLCHCRHFLFQRQLHNLTTMAAGPADASDAAAVDGGNQTRRRYVIDVRIFLAVITTSMALSFFAGVAFGPTPADLDAVRGGVAHLPETTTPSIPASAEIGNREEDDEEEEDRIVQPRRLPTAHSAELGARADKLKESHVNFHEPSYEDLGDGAVRREVDLAMIAKEQADEDGDDDHLPQGQHLLVDIKNVEADFLNSEDRLAHAMVSVVKAGGLTLLSYHCHSLMPAGVSCVGVLLESHVSFHTWPEEGVITLDLFTCGSAPLVPVVPQIEELFGVPRAVVRDDGTPDPVEKEKIITKWSHELRGFRHPKKRTNDYLDNSSDLSHWVLSPLVMSLKKQIVSTLTPFQRIDIWDVIDEEDTPSYQDAMKYDLQPGDPRWLSNEIVMPDRLLFLDGTLQVRGFLEKVWIICIAQKSCICSPYLCAPPTLPNPFSLLSPSPSLRGNTMRPLFTQV